MSSDPHNKPEEDQEKESARFLHLVSSVKKLAGNNEFFDFSIDLLSKYGFRVLVVLFALYGTYSALQHVSFRGTDSSLDGDSVDVEEEPNEEHLIGNYDHVSIEKEGMEKKVCDNPDFQEAKLGKTYPGNEYNIRSQGVQYRKERVEVLPAFRWACRYKITAKTDSSQNSLGEGSDASSNLSGSPLNQNDELVGLSLDEFHCTGEDLSKAVYLDFEDPYSWYCVNPNANF